MKKNFKRVTALFLAVVLSLSLCIMASAANVTDFKDYDAKAWYADAVKAAVDNGLLYGKSATKLDPNGYLTRAEMAAIIDRAFGCYKKADISAFKDVSKTAWYYDAIAMANQMGTFEGTSKTTMAPDRNISRQEIFAVMARALQLDTEQFKATDLSGFTDAEQVSSWAVPYVKAMIANKYVAGRPTGLAPQANITRAEFCQLFYNVLQTYIIEAGTYSKNMDGNVLIRSKDVTLKDMTVNGDLIIGNGAADGKVTLSNVKIKGRLVVWGGGTEAVYCNDETEVDDLVVCRVDGPVKVIFDRASSLLVYDKINVRITERAKAFPETEVIFLGIKEILAARDDLNAIVDDTQIKAVVSSHMYALIEDTKVTATLCNKSEKDTYRFVITDAKTGDVLSETVELAPGKGAEKIMLKQALPFGNYDCIVTVTAVRNGIEIGSAQFESAIHVAYMWALGGGSV